MGLGEDVYKIKEKMKEQEELDNLKKQKKFRLPFGKKVGKSQAKKNYVTVIKINENNNVDIVKKQITEQTFMEDGVPRLGTPDYVLRWKKNPLVILPSWSTKPYSPTEQHAKSLEDGSNTNGYKILMARMQNEQVGVKKPMGNAFKIIIGLALAAIIGYALITGGV